jgi:ABC-type nitrate/sulfonate/bicarbonate transport system substrate-binding protein
MKTDRVRTCRHLAAAAAIAFAVTGATGTASLAADAFKVALLTQPGVWDAALFAARDRGFFKDEGLEVSFVSPATPADGIKLVVSGGAQVATAHSTEVIIARSRGLPAISRPTINTELPASWFRAPR